MHFSPHSISILLVPMSNYSIKKYIKFYILYKLNNYSNIFVEPFLYVRIMKIKTVRFYDLHIQITNECHTVLI